MSKYVIYTCIVGGYDELLQPAVTDPDFDFVCFVGRGEKTADRIGAWAVREFDCGLEDLRIVSRYPKMHPHVLLPEYEASVWIDGNVRIMDGTIFEAVRARMADGSVYAGVRHPSRDCLYAEAWKLFCSHPFLGVGLGYNGDHFAINTMQFYWFHSTLFQVLANMGVVGVLAYAFYYIARFRTLRKLRNPFNVFMLIAWLGFEGYSMMDTGTFVPFPTMALVLVTAGIAELISSRPQFRGEADAYNRTFSRAGVAAEARRYDAFTPAYVREAA